MSGQLPLKGRTLQILSIEEVLQIHQAVLEVLKDPGVKINNEEALEILSKAGADVEQERMIAHIPSHLVEYALSKVPKTVTLCGRDPKYDLKLGTGKIHFRNTQGSLYVIDFDSGEKRRPTKKDLENLVRIQDALENAHLIYAEVIPWDVAPKALDRHINQALLSNTEKPCSAHAYDGEGAKDLIRMGVAIAGSEEGLRRRPIVTTSIGVVSPLSIEREQADVLLEICRFGLPLRVFSLPSAGGTAPVTLAGALVLQTAEILAGLTLAQVVRPGIPIIAQGIGSILDQRYGSFIFACPESSLIAGAASQIFRYYGLPHVTYGAWTEANVLDMQAGYEMGIFALFNALSGAEVVVGVPSGIGTGSQHSLYELPVIANEICGLINRLLQGIEVNPDTIAVDVIREIGPGGQYLTHRHTRKHYKNEGWDAKLGNRLSMFEWEENGSKDIQTKAREQVKKILATHYPKPLDADIQKKIQQIVDEAEG